MKLKSLKRKQNKSHETIFGFRKIDRPKFIDSLVFPADTLTSLDSEQVSDLHAKYTLLYAFANQGLADANVSILKLQNQRNNRENELYRENPRLNNIEKWKRDARIREDTQIESFHFRLCYQHQVRITLEMLITNYEKFINALSRELSRKNFEKNPKGF